MSYAVRKALLLRSLSAAAAASGLRTRLICAEFPVGRDSHVADDMHDLADVIGDAADVPHDVPDVSHDVVDVPDEIIDVTGSM